MLKRIFQKELLTAVRNRQVFVFGLLVAGLLLAAGAAGYAGFRQQRAQMARAQQARRQEWLSQGEKHPHIATHFGTFVFKPKTGLSFFDYGLEAYTGTSVYLEAHYEHEFMFRPAQDYSALIRFGELSGALVLQVLLPLLVIFLCFGAFTRERESSTLRLLLSQGVRRPQLAWGKALAYYALVLALLLPTLALVGGLALGRAGSSTTAADVAGRLLGLGAVYAAYFLGFVCLCVLVSARAASSRNALLTLLTIWIVFAVVLPKTTAALGDQRHPLPTLQAYQDAITQEADAGLPGDLPKAGRKARLEQQYLKRYHADSVQHLPLNFEWAAAQAAESYHDRVQARHRAGLVRTLEAQNRLSTLASFADPYLAVRSLSMALAGTDLYTSLDFQQQATDYRAGLIRQLNLDAAQHSKYGQFYEYHTGAGLWAQVRDFAYRLPAAGRILPHYRPELLALLLWALGLPLALHLGARRLPL